MSSRHLQNNYRAANQSKASKKAHQSKRYLYLLNRKRSQRVRKLLPKKLLVPAAKM